MIDNMMLASLTVTCISLPIIAVAICFDIVRDIING